MPDFVEVMKRAFYGGGDEVAQINKKASKWVLLPTLCCQAAGGDSHWADDLAAAWYLFYAGANLMDKVEDQDNLPNPWASQEVGVALNAASGLFFTASLILNNLYSNPYTLDSAQAAIDSFHRHFLLMCGGQHRDLTQPEPNLKQYWEIIEAKSGAFFALACQSGARLATDDNQRLNDFYQFGLHLGVLIQVLDDLEELKVVENPDIGIDPRLIRRSLPVVYAMEVLPEPDRNELQYLLNSGAATSTLITQILNKIDQSGAVLYILTQIQRLRELSIKFLERATSDQGVLKDLTTLVEGLNKNNQVL